MYLGKEVRLGKTAFQSSRRTSSRLAAILLVTALTQTSTIAIGDATIGHFSQRQIASYMQSVTAELQLSKNWNASFGSAATGTLYCNSTLLGQGVRAGSFGLFTWFTCSAMHKLEANTSAKTPLTCTGFSSAVWIQPGASSISYQAIGNGSEFLAFKASAPPQVQAALDATYREVNKTDVRVVVGRAITGASDTSKQTVQPPTCQ